MTDDIVARAKAALEGVTPGPWDVRDGFVYPLAIRCGLGSIRPPDAEFIAAARELVPELVAEVEAVRAELAMARDGVRPMTEVESNLMTQVLDLRRENARLRAAIDALRKDQ